MSQPPLNSPLNYATPYPPGVGGPVKNPGGFRKGLFGWIVFIGLAVMLFILVSQNKRKTPEIPLNEFQDRLLAGDVLSLSVETDAVAGEFRTSITPAGNGVSIKYFRTSLPTGTTGNWEFSKWVLENRHGAAINVSNEQNFVTSFLVPLIPWVLIFFFIWFFVLRNLRKTGTAARPALPAGPIEVIIVNREPK